MLVSVFDTQRLSTISKLVNNDLKKPLEKSEKR